MSGTQWPPSNEVLAFPVIQYINSVDKISILSIPPFEKSSDSLGKKEDEKYKD
jgi:hypothetical protein